MDEGIVGAKTLDWLAEAEHHVGAINLGGGRSRPDSEVLQPATQPRKHRLCECAVALTGSLDNGQNWGSDVVCDGAEQDLSGCTVAIRGGPEQPCHAFLLHLQR